MEKSFLLADYNPIALLLNKALGRIELLGDTATYMQSLVARSPPQNVKKYLFVIGLLGLTYKVLKSLSKILPALSWVIPHIRSRLLFSVERLKQKYGNCWVMITGFTFGIGWAFTEAFAQMGFNLVLVGKNPEQMMPRLQYLDKYFPSVKYEVVEVDATDDVMIDKMKTQIHTLKDKIDIGMLVNNIGIGGGGYFFDLDPQKLLHTVGVNYRFNKTMIELMVPIFRTRETRSAIMNISSATSLYNSPCIGTYSSAKRLLRVFGLAMAEQHKDKIDIITAMPFGVITALMNMRKNVFSMIRPDQCATSVIYDLLDGQKVTYGHTQHKMAGTLFSLLSETGSMKIYADNFKKARNA